MSARTENFWNFDLFDFFVGVISGLIALAVFYSLLPDYVVSQIPQIDGVVLLFGILILTYVLGRLIQAASTTIEEDRLGRRTPFEDELEGSDENDVYSRFLKVSQDYFNIEIAEEGEKRDTDLGNLFMLTRAYLTNNNVSPRVERFQATYLLFLNLSFIFLLGAIGHAASLLAYFVGYDLVSIPGSIVLIGVLVAGAVLSYDQRKWYHERMAKVMIYDFYADVGNSQVQTE